MAKEGFFSIETSLNVLKELFKEELISFDKQYDEFTLKYKGFCLWIYAYKEDGGDISENEITKLNLNVKYESQIPSQVIADFKKKLNLKCKTTKNNIISSYKEDYFFDRKKREDRVLDDLDRLFQN